MDDLDEGWLSIELGAVGAEIEEWSVGLKESFDSLRAAPESEREEGDELGETA